jgi:hypothetical protein
MISITRAEQAKLEEKVIAWVGGYVGVGEALVQLQELKGKDFSKYVPERFGITYHRAKQLQYAAEMAAKCKEAGLPIPHNEAGAYRLYRLAKSPSIGDKAALDLWTEVSAKNRKPTVAQINEAIDAKWPADTTGSPTVAEQSAADWIGKAQTYLQEAHNLLVSNPAPVDLVGIDEILTKIRMLAPALKKAA